MGAMPFSEFFKGRKGGIDTDIPEGSPASAGGVSATDKLAILEDLERTGLAWFWATDPQGKVAYLSPSIVEGLGSQLEKLLGQPLQHLFVPISGEGDGRSLGLKLSTRKGFSGYTVESSNQNSKVVLRLSGRPLHNDAGDFIGFRGSALDITDEFRSEEEASRLAQFDSLTGLANRHRMEQRIDSTLTTFRSAKRSAALMMLDLDRFKQVNDTLGHAAGDQLLQQVAERLHAVVAGRGEIGRIGGDEFQLLVPDMDDRGELGEIAKKIIQMLSQPYSVEEGRCIIGCSVGIAIAPYDGVEREELMRAADLALYASKNGGRGQFRFYAADLEHEANLRRRMEEDLAEAIEAGHFTVEYLPTVSLKDNRVTGLEAQYCWQDEDRGRVSADTFLPIAEGSRLIIPIGEWAMRKACEEAVDWPSSLRISFAVSPVQFAANGFAEMVETVLKDTGLDPARLELQFNEAVLLGDAAKVDKALATLFKLGVRLSLDQFGSGLSSLSYLRRAPFDALRIGANFFEPVMGSEVGDMEMVRAVIALAGAMGMETAATGVHAMPLMAQLKTRGIDQVSGFVFAEALTAEQVREELAQGEWTLAPTATGTQRASRRTVFRKIGVIHEDHYYDVTLRNLSRSGAMIQGLEDVPAGTMFVLDFGSGQLAVCGVRRSMDDTQGVEFEQELVDDGAGGLCTRHRVSPYELAAAGAPLEALHGSKNSSARSMTSGSGFAQFKLSDNAPKQGHAA
ncbi:sensor domain-containing protein [Qipengyuania marisflavi]|uniref:EAL domain-containing protein n=1 Tax=Qipengyuania marisflavi TaxID=2486356 RepID=A0A5S3P9S8_9SPHN|nr:EAL domain-containing protein [Qipengyuania marisflavi]TMM50093.1 EAL domain-containing protein [Qipengyuania marisflavi]